MAKGDDLTGKQVFEQPATLREPAAPSVPRAIPTPAASVIPLPNEEQARAGEARPTTVQDAREATDALIHEILEEDFLSGAAEPRTAEPRAQPSKEEDWPAELHALPLQEE
ncbi:hypothetical protein JQX13_10835 [Archangium violaceum]|uniref:hypothetical protein n=1 Tax=Archangium violaceum TaxID=83451 RepID=UPI00193B0633|nr:hypothetical protein [Archangium violaceum]QRK10536.1 hypothetical protein JQX13_10835 [Archangium violaceum]